MDEKEMLEVDIEDLKDAYKRIQRSEERRVGKECM